MKFKTGFERQASMYGFFNSMFKTTHECETNLIFLECFHEQKFSLFIHS